MVPVGTFTMTFGGPSARKLLTQKPPFPRSLHVRDLISKKSPVRSKRLDSRSLGRPRPGPEYFRECRH